MSSQQTHNSVHGLYTAAMLADLLEVPAAAIRRWHRRGYLTASALVKRLPYFASQEVHVARTLSGLLKDGCALSSIDRRLEELDRLFPEVSRPLVELPIVVEGRSLLIQRGDDLTEMSGQLRLDFPLPDEDELPAPVAIPLHENTDADVGPQAAQFVSGNAEQMRDQAAEFESQGQTRQAIELYRAVVVSGQGTAEDHFTLGDLLYRQGDLPAARERFYMAIELDENYAEARANLGCVLAEIGDTALAEASLKGAVDCHDEYADAHFHLARLLDGLHRNDEARQHWQKFLELAPESPWVEEARDRVAP